MKTRTLQLALVLTALSGAVSAQNPNRGEDQDRRPPPGPPMIAFFDANHDGELSAEEIGNACEALGKLDVNGDGRISREEIRPPKGDAAGPPNGGERQGPPRGAPPPLIAALDADKDGRISADEIENSSKALGKLDHNGDGELDPEELHPHGPPPPPFEREQGRKPSHRR